MGFGADESGGIVHHKGIITAAQPVAQSLAGGHVHAIVFEIGHLAPLAGFQVDELVRNIL